MSGVIFAAFQPPINQDMRHCALVITVSLFPFLLLSCEHKKEISPEQVESITFYAMPKEIETPNAIVSFQTVKSGYRDTLIVDRDFIREFTTMVNGLTPDRTVKSMDMRSAAVLATKTGDSLFVAFGENWGTAILRDHGKDKSPWRVNGQFMKDNPDLFRFIDERVYGPHPRDYWFDDETRAFHRVVDDFYQKMTDSLAAAAGIRIIDNESVAVDTTVNGCHIAYTIRDNDELAGYENDEYRFRCREVEMYLDRNGVKNHFYIKRNQFAKWVDEENMDLVSVQSFRFLGLDESGNPTFELMLCIPDTDIAYLFNICLADKMIISPIPIQWEE